jgi:hypothetical protein
VGHLQPTGLRPHFLDRISQFGEQIPIEWFLPSAPGSDGVRNS